MDRQAKPCTQEILQIINSVVDKNDLRTTD